MSNFIKKNALDNICRNTYHSDVQRLIMSNTGTIYMNYFIDENPVFTTPAVKEYLSRKGTKGKRSSESFLSYYRKTGRIIRVKRGLYATVPRTVSPKTFMPDPYLIASRAAHDSILSHHTALEFHGRAHSVFREFYFQTTTSIRRFIFNDCLFHPVSVPKSLIKKNAVDFGVIEAERNGLPLRVASLERTLVDSLDRPMYSGGWEEIWRSLESIEFFDLDKVVEYTLLLSNATTTAKVGYFLEQHKENLFVGENHLNSLRVKSPRQPHYMERSMRTNCRLIKGWNLMAPHEISNRTWSEVL